MRNDVARAIALRGAVALAATVVTLGLLAGSSGSAQAQIDISGDWDISFEGTLSGSCTDAVQQTGTELLVAFDCAYLDSAAFTGTIDPATGDFSLSGSVMGITVEFEGTASQDGSSMSGTWDASMVGYSGTFTATRTSETPSFVDLSGNWDFLLYGGLSATCEATLEQTLDDLSVSMDCGEVGTGSLSGSAHLLTGSFSVSGPLGESSFWLWGSGIDDEGVLRGSWSGEGDDAWGDFIAVPEGGLASGAMAVDCDGEMPGIQSYCSYVPEATFAVQIHVFVPPAGGYVALSSELAWMEGTLQYLPAGDPNDEALWGPCDDAERSIAEADGVSSVALGCAPALAEGDTSAGAVIQFEMRCPETYAWAELDLLSRDAAPDQGTYLLDSQGSPVDPVLLSASLGCYEPGQGGGYGPPADDALRGGSEGPAGDATATPTQTATAAAPTETPTDDVLAPTPTATPSADVQGLALPDTGSGPRDAGGHLLLVLLLGAGAMLIAAGVVGLRLGRRRREMGS